MGVEPACSPDFSSVVTDLFEYRKTIFSLSHHKGFSDIRSLQDKQMRKVEKAMLRAFGVGIFFFLLLFPAAHLHVICEA